SAFTLTIGSGAFVATGGNTGTLQSGTVNFGAAEGVIIANTTATIASAITGTGGLTISGGSTVNLQTNNNTYTASSVQTVTFGGAVTGGTFRLTFNSVPTGPISWSPNAATLAANIQAALDALPTIGAGNTLGAGTGTGPFSITFRNGLANAPQN